MSATFRVGIIGSTGRGNYGHGLDTVWKTVSRVEVAALADDDAAGRAAGVQRTGAKTAHADYRQMLDKERLDVVAVCPRWIDQHHAMCLACAEHGCHVYVEKPFCRTLEEADEIVREFEMRHLKLAIAHTNRYTPQLAIAQELIERGELGRLLELRGRGKEDRRGGGEDLWVLGSHVLDMIRQLAGRPEWCFATLTQDGRPVTKADVRPGGEGVGPIAGNGLSAMYGLGDGSTAYFASSANRAGRPSRYGLVICGSEGQIELLEGPMPSVKYL